MDNKTHHTNRFLTLSQCISRIIVSIILVAVVTSEAMLPTPWLLVLSAIALYTIVTGFIGRDPLLKLLKQSHPQLPDQKLSFAAQLECAAIGMICITIGILYRSSDTLLLRLLPFLGIYPILICAIKYDVLSHLLQSYSRSFKTRHEV